MDFDAFKRMRKPTAKGTVILSGILKRKKDKERSEIEEGLEEWEEEKRKKNERDNII